MYEAGTIIEGQTITADYPTIEAGWEDILDAAQDLGLVISEDGEDEDGLYGDLETLEGEKVGVYWVAKV